MEFVPWTSSTRIVQRDSGKAGVRSLSCAEQFCAMAFAQLSWRESLRDVEASLSANTPKLHAMGFRSPVKRSTLADANESRDWHIWSDLAAWVDSSCAQAVFERAARCRVGQHRVCAGLQHRRCVFKPVRLSAVLIDQCRQQAAHAAGPARRDPRVHPHQRWQAARRERAGHAAIRARYRHNLVQQIHDERWCEVSRFKACATAPTASYLAGRAQARSAARRTLAGAACETQARR